MDLRVYPLERGQPLEILVNGSPLTAYSGETVAGALLAAGIRTFRNTDETGLGRGQFCGMGVCYDCLVDVDGRHAQRACMTAVAPGMEIAIPVVVKEQSR